MRRFGFFAVVCISWILMGDLLGEWGFFIVEKLFSLPDLATSSSLIVLGSQAPPALLLAPVVYGAVCAAFFTWISLDTQPKTANEFEFLRARVAPVLPQSLALLCFFQTLALLPLLAIHFFPIPYRGPLVQFQLFEMMSVLPFLASLFALVWLFWKVHQMP